MIKLSNCSREPVEAIKQITYEQLNQMMEDLLKENGFY